MLDLTKNLNNEQKEAVLHEGSPLLILAGAGSGKTGVLTHRIAHFVENKDIPSHKILAVTFTNKAAKEMKERIKKLVSKGADFPFLGTFHSIGVRILKIDGKYIGIEPTFSIYDDSDQKDIIKEVMKDLNIDIKTLSPSSVQWAISAAKNEMIQPKQYGDLVSDLFTEQVAKIYPKYQSILEERNAVDFDDIILKTILLLKENKELRQRYIDRFDEVLVDEYQDTNKAQYSLIKLLAQDKQHISVVGDEDQSIYGWRGADIQNILSFEKDFKDPKIIKLEQNYRSTQIILDAAHSVIHKNTERREKKLWSQTKNGPNIQIYEAQNEIEEALFIVNTIKKEYSNQLNDIAILYRANAQSRALEEQFLKLKIPYKLVGGLRFYDRKEVKDAIAYTRMFYNSADTLSLLRIINTPARGIGGKTITELVGASKKVKMPIIDLVCNIALYEEYKAEVIPYKKLKEEHDKTPDNKQDNHLFSTDQKFMDDQFLNSLINFSNLINDSNLISNKSLVLLGRKLNQIKENMEGMILSEFIKYLLESLDYYKYTNDGTKEGENRMENLKELLSVAQKYDQFSLEAGISQFLEDISLIEHAQDNNDDQKQTVTLMTIHASKGLEFGTIFVAGLEEGIFPHSRSLASPKEMEEERRLAYVAITRAKKNLYLLYALSRSYFGSIQSNLVSRFISDIPSYLTDFKTTQDRYDWTSTNSVSKEYIDEEPIYIDVGDRVEHPQFGKGKVVEHDDQMVTIDFDNKGRTKLIAQYAKLKKI